MKRVLFVVGSMRKGSFNQQLAEEAHALVKDKVEVSFLSYFDLPFVNQDIEFPVLEEVERVRAEVRRSDAIWFFTPEYNGSYPAVVKNLLDWLSRPQVKGGRREESAISQKIVTASSAAGKSGGRGALKSIDALFHSIFAKPLDIEETGVSLSRESFGSGKLMLSENEKESLKRQAKSLLDALDS